VNIYILDWNGTLDTVEDPAGFVRSLQAKGHKVVLFTGNSHIQDEDVAEAVDVYAVKASESFRTMFDRFLEQWPETQKILYSDDERARAKVVFFRLDDEYPVEFEFLDPFHLEKHLSGLDA